MSLLCSLLYGVVTPDSVEIHPRCHIIQGQMAHLHRLTHYHVPGRRDLQQSARTAACNQTTENKN